MQDNIPDALIAAFERHYDFPWNEPTLRNERLAWRAAWAEATKPCLHQIQEPAPVLAVPAAVAVQLDANGIALCPLCGSESKHVKADVGGNRILCWNDDCECSSGYFCSKEEAIASWNARTALTVAPIAMDFAEAYEGARGDLSIWKRRALEAERDLRAERQTTSRLVAEVNAMNGPVHLGEAAAPVVLPEPVTWLIERSAFHVSPHGQDAKSNEWLEEAHEPGEEGSFPVYTEQQVRALLATGGQAQAVLTGELIEAVDAWFARNTGLGGCSDKDVAELAAIFAAPQAQADARDAWPSIESAPKDGTWIQLWRTPEPEESPVNSTPLVIGRWSDEEESFVWPDDQFYDPFTEHGKAKADQMVEAMQTYASNKFTHWAPLSMPSVHRAAIAAAKGE